MIILSVVMLLIGVFLGLFYLDVREVFLKVVRYMTDEKNN